MPCPKQGLGSRVLGDRPDGSGVWISIKYERPDSFCYHCGMIGHDSGVCKGEVLKDEKGARICGAWLAAGAERDREEALVKFLREWNEEDSRLQMPVGVLLTKGM
ncbi:hypothetical protein K1719_002935 [Acacia pycnantha]|nr:hypothetical protein K1719_002935 [Acacia pycnantha]